MIKPKSPHYYSNDLGKICFLVPTGKMSLMFEFVILSFEFFVNMPRLLNGNKSVVNGCELNNPLLILSNLAPLPRLVIITTHFLRSFPKVGITRRDKNGTENFIFLGIAHGRHRAGRMSYQDSV